MATQLFDQDVFAVIVPVFLFGLLFYRLWTGSTLPLPPGPPKLPLLGNLFNLPPDFEWEAFQRWGKQYSSSFEFPFSITLISFPGLDTDILYLTAPGQSILVLNSVDAVHDLLDKRSLIYSGRYVCPFHHG